VERFIEDYLGAPGHPEPFGGRTEEIRQLNQWLTDNSIDSRLLVAAPAGRGKSALLVRWTAQVRPPWRVLFIPVSIRRDTSTAAVFHQLLACGLAQLFDEEPISPSPGADVAEFYKDVSAEYFNRLRHDRDQHILVVIDGLDEAVGWWFDSTIIPSDLPGNMRVVVSAREQIGDRGVGDWLRRLHWESVKPPVTTFELSKLLAPQLREILASLDPALAQAADNAEIIQELERLTQGEPVLVRYYAEDLIAMGPDMAQLTPARLRGLRPGFAAYFQNWIDEQNRLAAGAGFNGDLIDAILAVLTIAPGPILHGDLAVLVGMLLRESRPLTARDLSPLRRFVLGDGVGNGYVLQHPRLASYLRHDYFKKGGALERTEATALEWGRQVLAALGSSQIAPSETPEFVLRHYSQLLIALRQPASAFAPLISDAWRQAWNSTEEGLPGFARDVRACWNAHRTRGAGTPDSSTFRTTLLSVMSISSMNCLEFTIPAPLLPAMVDAGLLSAPRALRSLDLASGGIGEWAACADLLARLSASEQAEKLATIFKVVRDLTGQRQIQVSRRRREALIAIAPLIPSSYAAAALDLVEGIETRWARLDALLAVASRISDELRPRVIEMVRNIGQTDLKVRGLAGIAIGAPEQQRQALQREAIDTARRVEAVEARAEVFVSIAQLLPAGDIEAALDTLMTTGTRTKTRLKLLGALLAHVGEERRAVVTEEILSGIKAWSSDFVRVEILEAVVNALPSYGMEWAFETAVGVDGTWSRFGLLAKMVADLSPAKRDVLLEMAHSVKADEGRALLLASLAPYFGGQEQQRIILTARDDIVGQDLAAGQFIWLADLLPHMTADDRHATLTGEFKKATRISDGWPFVRALASIAETQPTNHREKILALALSSAKACTDKGNLADDIDALFCLARQSTADRKALITKATERNTYIGVGKWLKVLDPAEVRSCVDDWLALPDRERDYDLWARRLDELAIHLLPAEAAKAREISRSIRDPAFRAWALAALVAAQAADARSPKRRTGLSLIPRFLWFGRDRDDAGLFAEAFETARQVPTAHAKASALAKLAPYLTSPFSPGFCDALREIDNQRFRAETIAQSASYLVAEQRKMMMAVAFADAERTGNSETWAWVRVADALTATPVGELAFQRALEALGKVSSQNVAKQLLLLMIPHLNDEQMRGVQRVAHSMLTGGGRGEVFLAVLERADDGALPALVDNLLECWSTMRRRVIFEQVPVFARMMSAHKWPEATPDLVDAMTQTQAWWP